MFASSCQNCSLKFAMVVITLEKKERKRKEMKKLLW